MNFPSRRISLVACLLAALPCAGRPGTARAALETVTAEIPRPEGLVTARSGVPAAEPRATERRGLFGISASSWVPRKLELESKLAGISPAESSGPPALHLSYETPPWRPLPALDLSARFGAGVSSLARHALAYFAGEPRDTRQQLYLIPVSVGLNVEPRKLRWKSFALHAGAAALPTLVLAEPSAFDDSRTLWGAPWEFTAGVTSRAAEWYPALRDLELELEAVTTVGKHDATDFGGTGLRAGVRFPL